MLKVALIVALLVGRQPAGGREPPSHTRSRTTGARPARATGAAPAHPDARWSRPTSWSAHRGHAQDHLSGWAERDEAFPRRRGPVGLARQARRREPGRPGRSSSSRSSRGPQPAARAEQGPRTCAQHGAGSANAIAARSDWPAASRRPSQTSACSRLRRHTALLDELCEAGLDEMVGIAHDKIADLRFDALHFAAGRAQLVDRSDAGIADALAAGVWTAESTAGGSACGRFPRRSRRALSCQTRARASCVVIGVACRCWAASSCASRAARARTTPQSARDRRERFLDRPDAYTGTANTHISCGRSAQPRRMADRGWRRAARTPRRGSARARRRGDGSRSARRSPPEPGRRHQSEGQPRAREPRALEGRDAEHDEQRGGDEHVARLAMALDASATS